MLNEGGLNGLGQGAPSSNPENPPASADQLPQAAATVPKLAVEVVWGNIREVEADLYAVGHYEQVLPRQAELELDRMVSGGPDASGEALVLTNLARRGVLRGALGDIDFFPWASQSAPNAKGRLVAVAGMGHLGRFGSLQLRLLARNLAWTAEALPDVRTVCCVLIGSGGGNMSLEAAVEGLMAGIVDAVGSNKRRGRIECLKLVERELGKARAIYRHLDGLRQRESVGKQLEVQLSQAGVVTGKGGKVGRDYCMALMIAAAASASQRNDEAHKQLLDGLLGLVDSPEDFAEQARKALGKVQELGDGDIDAIASKLTVGFKERSRDEPATTRVSYTREGSVIRAAALTDTAVLPERQFEIDQNLLDATANAMLDPSAAQLPDLSRFLARLVVPKDFRKLVEEAPRLVVEVDRAMAKLPWEMLSDRVDASDEAKPIALKYEVARQLRTTYSPPPGVERAPRWPLRALVIGDPGDPRTKDSLPGARREAIAVCQMLRAKKVEVTALIGAPSVPREGELRAFKAADRLEVLMQLLTGNYDLLHYAGHGDFDPEHPELTGWVFQGGLLTSRLLERIDIAPSLVVANACLSARTSEALAGGGRVGGGRTEADLLPGLADEFFRRGVRNYIGTAWEIDDKGAVEFAKTFYDALIPDATRVTAGASVGKALMQARLALAAKQELAAKQYNKDMKDTKALWAAYQHYGDPQHVVAPEGAATEAQPS